MARLAEPARGGAARRAGALRRRGLPDGARRDRRARRPQRPHHARERLLRARARGAPGPPLPRRRAAARAGLGRRRRRRAARPVARRGPRRAGRRGRAAPRRCGGRGVGARGRRRPLRPGRGQAPGGRRRGPRAASGCRSPRQPTGAVGTLAELGRAAGQVREGRPHLRRRPARAGRVGRPPERRRHRDPPDAHDRARDPDRLRGDGHGHRGAHGDRARAARRDRRPPPQPLDRRPGARRSTRSSAPRRG